MKKTLLVLVLLLTGLNFSMAQDDEYDERKAVLSQYVGDEVNERFFRIGVIPYQLLSRSSGLYMGFNVGKKWQLELRGTYTYATNYVSIVFPFSRDNFFYKGFNGSAGIYRKFGEDNSIGLMFIYRGWGYDNKWVYKDGVATYSSYSYQEKKSATINGFGFGVEYLMDLSSNHFDFGFFINLSVTQMTGNINVISGDSRAASQNPNAVYPRMETTSFIKPILTLGLKFGYRKQLKQKKSE